MLLKISSTTRSSRKLLAGALRVYAGHLAPGSRFPSENTLVSELKVARMTLRRAMDDLVAEGVLCRKWGSGTFVAYNDPDTIYFVLPTPGSRKGELRHFAMMGFYDAVCRSAGERGLKVAKLVASQTNRRDELDWEVFQFLPDGAKVILPGYWYSELFDFLNAKKCKVVFVSYPFACSFLYRDVIGDWFHLEYDLTAAAALGVEKLRALGAKNILLMDDDLVCTSPLQCGFKEAMGKDFRQELVISGAGGRYELVYNTVLYFLKSGDIYSFDAVLAANGSIARKALAACRNQNVKKPLIVLNEESGSEAGEFSSIVYDHDKVAKIALDKITAGIWQSGFESIKPGFREAVLTAGF